MRPSASGNTRSARTFSASRAACDSVSLPVIPSSTSSPGPISPTTSPSTVTDARSARCTSARMRSEQLLHRDVLDVGLHELAPARHVAGLVIQRAGIGLGVQDDAVGTARPGLLVGGVEERRGDALTAGAALDRQTAELDCGAHEHQPAGGHELAILNGDQVQGPAVAPVALLVAGYALFDAEDIMAKRKRRLELLFGPEAPDLEAERGVGGTRVHSRSLSHGKHDLPIRVVMPSPDWRLIPGPSAGLLKYPLSSLSVAQGGEDAWLCGDTSSSQQV